MYIYLEIYLFFSFSSSLVAHSYLSHSSLGIAAYGVLVLFEPFRNTWLALVYQGHATIEKQQKKKIITLSSKQNVTFWSFLLAPNAIEISNNFLRRGYRHFLETLNVTFWNRFLKSPLPISNASLKNTRKLFQSRRLLKMVKNVCRFPRTWKQVLNISFVSIKHLIFHF